MALTPEGKVKRRLDTMLKRRKIWYFSPQSGPFGRAGIRLGYTVASPEASASILWRSSKKAKEAAEAMKITAQDLLNLNVIDEIIDEPVGGAHREHAQIIMQTKIAIKDSIIFFKKFGAESLIEKRRDKFLEIGRNLNI